MGARAQNSSFQTSICCTALLTLQFISLQLFISSYPVLTLLHPELQPLGEIHEVVVVISYNPGSCWENLSLKHMEEATCRQCREKAQVYRNQANFCINYVLRSRQCRLSHFILCDNLSPLLISYSQKIFQIWWLRCEI